LAADIGASSVKPFLKFKSGHKEKFVKEQYNEKMKFYRIGILFSLDFKGQIHVM
jgi:hypothetical protein